MQLRFLSFIQKTTIESSNALKVDQEEEEGGDEVEVEEEKDSTLRIAHGNGEKSDSTALHFFFRYFCPGKRRLVQFVLVHSTLFDSAVCQLFSATMKPDDDLLLQCNPFRMRA